MAKAILKFDLDNPDDKMAHLRAIKSTDITLLVWEFAYNIRKELEHELDRDDILASEMLELVYDKFWTELNDRGINLDELIN